MIRKPGLAANCQRAVAGVVVGYGLDGLALLANLARADSLIFCTWGRSFVGISVMMLCTPRFASAFAMRGPFTVQQEICSPLVARLSSVAVLQAVINL